MVTKNRNIIVKSTKYVKVNHSTFRELAERGYQYVVAADVVPDKISGFKDAPDGVLNVECIPYKKEPELRSKAHTCYPLPSNRLNEMICRETDFIMRLQFLGL